MKIRKATKKDIDELIQISKEVKEFEVDGEGNSFWSKEQLIKWVGSKKDIVLIAEEDRKIIGFVLFAHHVPTGKVTWENAWVSAEERGKGLISKLYNKAEKELKKLGAKYICDMTKPTSRASLKMQEKLGFEKGLKFIWMGKFLK